MGLAATPARSNFLSTLHWFNVGIIKDILSRVKSHTRLYAAHPGQLLEKRNFLLRSLSRGVACFKRDRVSVRLG